jgi:transcriptional regulator with XRE-family HTH domain
MILFDNMAIMSATRDAAGTLTPALCRAARSYLGWTIGEFAASAGVGVSTIISFESGQRRPMAANLAAIARTFAGAGVTFTERSGTDGRGFKSTRSGEALRDMLMLGALKESHSERLGKMQARVEQFLMESKEFHAALSGQHDISSRVRTDMDTLRNVVDREIVRRARLQLADESTQLLAGVTDYLHQYAVSARAHERLNPQR